MDIGLTPMTPMTPMSETSTLYLQPFGQPEADLLRLKRVREEVREPQATKKEIYRVSKSEQTRLLKL